MANLLSTNFTHTYAGQEFLTELFYDPQPEGEDIFADYRLMDNVDSTRNLYFNNTLTKTLVPYSTCGRTTTGSTTLSDKTLTVYKLKQQLEQCEDQFEDTVLGELRKKGTKITDLTGTVLEDIIRTQALRALRYDIPRQIWFNKQTSASTHYTAFDGFFQLFFDSSASLAHSINMAYNTDYETSSSSDTLSTDGAYKAMKKIYENQGANLRAIPNNMKKFFVTSTVYDNLLVTYENTGTDLGLTRLSDGIGTLKFRGITVKEMPYWDYALTDTTANPMSAQIGSNAIVLTMNENLVVGTDMAFRDASFEVWYSRDDEKLYTDFKLKLGVQYLHNDYVAFAY